MYGPPSEPDTQTSTHKIPHTLIQIRFITNPQNGCAAAPPPHTLGTKGQTRNRTSNLATMLSRVKDIENRVTRIRKKQKWFLWILFFLFCVYAAFCPFFSRCTMRSLFLFVSVVLAFYRCSRSCAGIVAVHVVVARVTACFRFLVCVVRIVLPCLLFPCS